MNWTIQILVDGNYIDYIHADPLKLNDYTHIRGLYFGSGTRQNTIGTFYYKSTHEILPLSLRILNDEKKVVKDIEFTVEMINIIINNERCYKSNEFIIFYRDLYRFHNYPFEISSIAIKI